MFFSFLFVDFGLGDLELAPRTPGKGKLRVVELFLLCKNIY